MHRTLDRDTPGAGRLDQPGEVAERRLRCGLRAGSAVVAEQAEDVIEIRKGRPGRGLHRGQRSLGEGGVGRQHSAGGGGLDGDQAERVTDAVVELPSESVALGKSRRTAFEQLDPLGRSRPESRGAAYASRAPRADDSRNNATIPTIVAAASTVGPAAGDLVVRPGRSSREPGARKGAASNTAPMPKTAVD